ncbi:uncharacterized protein DSM5745_02913 [Aspergillus mulundensis]|uniref:Uncharacterized protein n=1 Tax=Aspergillus mulundensis TaxID=1810919 RepID=A0A3D8SJC4_9EURO|nr:Uncharacterized protein DSM5745_02913 [Aspergillus mulundensis]RDW86271.1 Uncharacterized protein DSM5745_02913 [Aspergillus mulundensis]
MANGYARDSGELNALPKSRNRSQTTIGLPPTPSPQKKRASSFYPPRGPDLLEETNPDPFYLEHSLTNTTSWGSCQQGLRNARSGEDIQKYFMVSVVKSGKDAAVPPAAPRTIKSQANIDRSTLSAVELEHQLSLQEIGGQSWRDSQTEATPDLTPSSSFSSNHSSPIYPDPVFKATEQLYRSFKQAQAPTLNRAYPYSSTPLNDSQATIPTEPSSPPNASSETITMPRNYDASSLRGKPLPSLPPVPRPSTAHPSKKQPPSRLIIEPSMISPPSLINPVTLEPHRSHFDQALFIPANECPSPVPSPGPPSPSVDRQPPVPSIRERPSTSTSEMHPEQSVWESDSDAEDSDPRSLSRKPMDTLKKVRSRVQLRVAKSTPKLQINTANNAALEKFPTMPDPPPPERWSSSMKTALQTRSGKDILRPTAHQTLRLVAPSTTSLVHPGSRRNSAKSQTYGIDRSTAAAAIQAKSRRRQRSTSPETSLSAEREKMCTFCREERSDRTIHHSLTLSRPPLYKRVWESLRVLGCHTDITSTRPRKGL